ncbi:hypothetical protein HPB47_019804 [Ixodes persulcatus]|uniref:Uncharacterized protein n=1 Tax=Ixodes persulcatus TaxID=34615 RepID=A0AC60QJM9_IXOPE|nr:hypothetical protein HPB47_019804 [Ixodes persulcatus]
MKATLMWFVRAEGAARKGGTGTSERARSLVYVAYQAAKTPKCRQKPKAAEPVHGPPITEPPAAALLQVSRRRRRGNARQGGLGTCPPHGPPTVPLAPRTCRERTLPAEEKKEEAALLACRAPAFPSSSSAATSRSRLSVEAIPCPWTSRRRPRLLVVHTADYNPPESVTLADVRVVSECVAATVFADRGHPPP